MNQDLRQDSMRHSFVFRVGSGHDAISTTLLDRQRAHGVSVIIAYPDCTEIAMTHGLKSSNKCRKSRQRANLKPPLC